MTEAQEDSLQEARELAERAMSNGEVVSTLALDSYVPLLAEITECQNNVTFWSKRLDRLKGALMTLLGSAHTGTVNGETAVTFEPVNRFNASAFQKKYPNLYRAYTHIVAKEELDMDALRTTRPDLYQEFQTRPLRITYVPPGSP